MNPTVFSPARARLLATLLATLLVALLCAGSIGFAAQASASSDAVTVAKKKKQGKKCKKGYVKKTVKKKGKKVKKCVKKKSSAKSDKVSSVSVQFTDVDVYRVHFSGTVTTKTPMTELPVKVIVTYGRSVDTLVKARGDGTSTTLTFQGYTRNPSTAPGAPRGAKLTLEAIADGISSGVKTR